jgi:pseudouridine kinase
MTAIGSRIAVVGGALVDVRATTSAGWTPGQSLPGRVRLLPGGAARNVAVNLARLGYSVTLFTAVGHDALGDWLLDATAAAGVDVSRVRRAASATGMVVSTAAQGGEVWCISDAAAVESLVPTDLESWRPAFDESAIVVSDANLSETTHAALSVVAASHPRALLATSPRKAVRLRGALPGAALVVCNRGEALALTGLPETLSWQALGMALLTEGVACVVLTQGAGGVGVTTSEEAVAVPARDVPVSDEGGAGDAVAAIGVHAVLSGLAPDRTAELAAEAAALTVQSEENTPVTLAQVLGA